MSQHLQQLLAALGARVGIADLALNDDNVCRLVLDRTLVIDIEHLPDTDVLQVYSVVGPHPGDNLELCRRMLAANLFGQGTGGAVLGLDEQRGEILLSHSFDLSTVTADKFVQTLDAFVGFVETWTAEIRDLMDEEEDDEEPRSSEGPGAFIRV